MLGNLPWTLLVMLPDNEKIKAAGRKGTSVSEAEAQAMLARFDRQHLGRIAFGLGALALSAAAFF